MTEFLIITRGEGVKSAIDRGYVPAEVLAETLQITPEPLLERDQLDRLREFLRTAPSRRNRRTIRQREDAEELAGIVRASTADALIDEAKELLLKCLEGKLSRRPGRPKIPTGFMSDYAVVPGLAAELKYAVELRLQQELPLDIPGWGHIGEHPDSRSLPLKERALTIVHKALQDRGYQVPSVARLRNRLSERKVAPVGFFVKPETENE